MNTIDKYNPFNPLKVLKHIEYWKKIPKHIPPPIFVTVDPINICNFKCIYCNSATVRNKNIQMDKNYLIYLANFISEWGVKAVCIAGGGEPLLNENLPFFLNECKKRNLETSIVTNGSELNNKNLIPHLINCKWIGISIDSATDKTLSKLKNTPPKTFEKIIDNIKELINYKNENSSKTQITYKFLIHPYNYIEILKASKIAQEIGCDLIHLRPYGEAWFNLHNNDNTDNTFFTEDMINESNFQIKQSKELYETEDFKIYNTMYKFTHQWKPNITYKKCYALYTNCYFSPDKKVRLCCDRRGDENLELCDINHIIPTWGSNKHRDIINNINITKCPRCTYSHINEVFENVILEDKMMCNFI